MAVVRHARFAARLLGALRPVFRPVLAAAGRRGRHPAGDASLRRQILRDRAPQGLRRHAVVALAAVERHAPVGVDGPLAERVGQVRDGLPFERLRRAHHRLRPLELGRADLLRRQGARAPRRPRARPPPARRRARTRRRARRRPTRRACRCSPRRWRRCPPRGRAGGAGGTGDRSRGSRARGRGRSRRRFRPSPSAHASVMRCASSSQRRLDAPRPGRLLERRAAPVGLLERHAARHAAEARPHLGQGPGARDVAGDHEGGRLPGW